MTEPSYGWTIHTTRTNRLASMLVRANTHNIATRLARDLAGVHRREIIEPGQFRQRLTLTTAAVTLFGQDHVALWSETAFLSGQSCWEIMPDGAIDLAAADDNEPCQPDRSCCASRRILMVVGPQVLAFPGG